MLFWPALLAFLSALGGGAAAGGAAAGGTALAGAGAAAAGGAAAAAPALLPAAASVIPAGALGAVSPIGATSITGAAPTAVSGFAGAGPSFLQKIGQGFQAKLDSALADPMGAIQAGGGGGKHGSKSQPGAPIQLSSPPPQAGDPITAALQASTGQALSMSLAERRKKLIEDRRMMLRGS